MRSRAHLVPAFGAGTANGTKIHIFGYGGGSIQQWSLRS
jgi:hypothetical protein